MAIRRILKHDDLTLLKNSRPVERFDDRLAQLLDDLAQTMHGAEGCGLAAVQVGVLRRAAVIDCGDGSGVTEIVNPEIIESSGSQEEQEGCLSFPGEYGITRRPAVVKLRAQNRRGQWCFYKAEGLRARAFCHEIDHMNGVLFQKHVIRKE
ncbi:MAG: peptide deformylase [Oscillospiraceae bacterium]|nr:peptide deformylase [Oscillospiraceae bacterium]